MKLIDKFSVANSTEQSSALTDEQKRQLKGIAKSSDWALNKAAQELGLTAPEAPGQPLMPSEPSIPVPHTPRPPVAPNGWTKTKIRNQLKKLRSIGMSDEDAINKVIEMGAAGDAANSPIFRELARSLYWQTVPVGVLEDWLSNRSAQMLTSDDGNNPAGFGDSGAGRGPPYSDMQGTGKIGEEGEGVPLPTQCEFCQSPMRPVPNSTAGILAMCDSCGWYLTKDRLRVGGFVAQIVAQEAPPAPGAPPAGPPQSGAPPPPGGEQPPDLEEGAPPEGEQALPEVLDSLIENAQKAKELVGPQEPPMGGSGANPTPLAPNNNPAAAPISQMASKNAAEDDPLDRPDQQKIDQKKWEQKQKNLSQENLREQLDPKNVEKHLPLQPGILKNLSKDQLRKLIEEKTKEVKPTQLSPIEPEYKPKYSPPERLPYSPAKTPQNIDPLQNKLSGTSLEDLQTLMQLDLPPNTKKMIEEEIAKKFRMTTYSPPPVSKDPAMVVERQFGKKYEELAKNLTGKEFVGPDGQKRKYSPEEAQAQVNKMYLLDVFSEFMGREVPQVSRGGLPDAKPSPDLKPTTLDLDVSPEEMQQIGDEMKFAPGGGPAQPYRQKPELGQQIMETAPDPGTRSPSYKGGPSRAGKPMKYLELLPASLPGIPNVMQFVMSLPKQYSRKPVKDQSGKPLMTKDSEGNPVPVTRLIQTGYDINKMSDEDVHNVGKLVEIMNEAYQFNKDKMQQGLKVREMQERGTGGRPITPKTRNELGLPKFKTVKPVVEQKPLLNVKNVNAPGKYPEPGPRSPTQKHVGPSKLPVKKDSAEETMEKKSVDGEAKEYYHELFGDYGDMLSRDRAASIMDSIDEVANAHSIKLNSEQVSTLLDFLDRPYTASLPTDIQYDYIHQALDIANIDDRLAAVVDKVLLDHIFKVGATDTTAFLRDEDKLSMLRVATQIDAGMGQKLLKYVAAEKRFKMPKVNEQQPDQVKDVEELKDTAMETDGETTHRPGHLPIEVVDHHFSSMYLKLTLKWDPKHPAAKQSLPGLQHQMISFVKGLESAKEFVDIGFLGQVQLQEFDPKKGHAVAFARTKKPADVPPTVQTIPDKAAE